MADVGLWAQHGNELTVIAGVIATVATATWHGSKLISGLRVQLAGISGHLKTLNGQVAENTLHRRASVEDPPVRRSEIHEIENYLNIIGRQSQAQLDDLNERRAEKGIPPISFQ